MMIVGSGIGGVAHFPLGDGGFGVVDAGSHRFDSVLSKVGVIVSPIVIPTSLCRICFKTHMLIIRNSKK